METPPKPLVLYDDDEFVTAVEAADRMGIPVRLIYDWKYRELLTVQGFVNRRQPLFLMRELWEVEFVTRTGQGARRRS